MSQNMVCMLPLVHGYGVIRDGVKIHELEFSLIRDRFHCSIFTIDSGNQESTEIPGLGFILEFFSDHSFYSLLGGFL